MAAACDDHGQMRGRHRPPIDSPSRFAFPHRPESAAGSHGWPAKPLARVNQRRGRSHHWRARPALACSLAGPRSQGPSPAAEPTPGLIWPPPERPGCIPPPSHGDSHWEPHMAEPRRPGPQAARSSRIQGALPRRPGGLNPSCQLPPPRRIVAPLELPGFPGSHIIRADPVGPALHRATEHAAQAGGGRHPLNLGWRLSFQQRRCWPCLAHASGQRASRSAW